jgi:hypothetical protein
MINKVLRKQIALKATGPLPNFSIPTVLSYLLTTEAINDDWVTLFLAYLSSISIPALLRVCDCAFET